jgi:hypothetical protein
MMMQQVGHLLWPAPPWAAALPSSYITWVELIFHSCSSLDLLVGPFSIFPLIYRSIFELGEALLKLFFHQHHRARVLLECPGGSSNSSAPLERGIKGHHRAIRMTEYESTAHL